MPIDSAMLTAELARLRKGRAMLDPDLITKLGPQTTAAFGIDAGDKVPVIRRKAAARIKSLLKRSPDLQLAALAALALAAQADQRLLKDREAWLAERLTCDLRTARRRVSRSMKELVDAAAENDHVRDLPDSPRDDGFTVRTFWATMRLDTARPELHERRKIVVTADRLDGIVSRLTVPRSTVDGDENGIDVRAGAGASMTNMVRCSPEDFEFTLALPRAFKHGDTHEYDLYFVIPAGQPMRPHYVFQPLVPCEQFELTVRFDPARLPTDIWLIDGVTPRALDHDQARSHRLAPNADGTVRQTFTDLRQGMAYGVRWSPVLTP